MDSLATLALALVVVGAAWPAVAGSSAPATAPTAADKGKDKGEGGGGGDDSRPEHRLPAVVEKAIAEKEKEVVAARREGIRLLEDFLRSSPKSRETAEALYKLAELYWEDSKAAYLDKMGSYQAAVTECHRDRATCPRVPRRPPRLDLAQAQGVYDRLIREYPRFRKIDTVIYLYAFSLRDQGRLGDSIKYFQTILDRFPALPVRRGCLDGDRRVSFLRAAELQDLSPGVREGAGAPQVLRCTTWRCSRPRGVTGSSATRTNPR